MFHTSCLLHCHHYRKINTFYATIGCFIPFTRANVCVANYTTQADYSESARSALTVGPKAPRSVRIGQLPPAGEAAYSKKSVAIEPVVP
jgi:hypothetical protein